MRLHFGDDTFRVVNVRNCTYKGHLECHCSRGSRRGKTKTCFAHQLRDFPKNSVELLSHEKILNPGIFSSFFLSTFSPLLYVSTCEVIVVMRAME
ncbi:hypothetical protein Y032_0837g2605 [Ancylostoma ceylanicum]|uniref:Uncharacterized protein n=1 Tax=Ancylostoma ceylanicum TaxID=53326 RepID=A0A016WCJ4_9BILA|nr:hypothetical protein Y032_0837g2605 [Ancylostoma ceylanicum]